MPSVLSTCLGVAAAQSQFFVPAAVPEVQQRVQQFMPRTYGSEMYAQPEAYAYAPQYEYQQSAGSEGTRLPVFEMSALMFGAAAGYMATKKVSALTVAARPSARAPAVQKELYAADKEATRKEAAGLEAVTLNSEAMEWVQCLAEGWASPLEGFMTEEQYLTCMHFQMVDNGEGEMVPMPVPIVLPITDADKARIQDKSAIALKNEAGDVVAVLRDLDIFEHRKEERATRTFGCDADTNHPYIEKIFEQGDWCVGGKIEVLDRIQYNDGMDQWRLSPKELDQKFTELDADAVFVFQLRNPVHNGHALLMQDTARRLKEMGYKKPVLWLSPLGGWTKDDDVPLDTRMKQHQAIIKNGVFGDTEVVLGIFPSPMLYGGPREVQWHASGRLPAGITHYIVGRDPAGMSHPNDHAKQPGLGDDLYNIWHGQMMLGLNPVLKKKVELLPFKFASYDTKAGKMDFFDPARKEDFQSISGTKMRKMAADGTTPPTGFMDPEGWQVLVKYYQSKQKA
jgi:3'-phosphoadenosine 5'-phosphosulfate synthase